MQGILGLYVHDNLASGKAIPYTHSHNIGKIRVEDTRVSTLCLCCQKYQQTRTRTLPWTDSIRNSFWYISQWFRFWIVSNHETQVRWLTNTEPETFAGVNVISKSTAKTFKDENIKILNNLIKLRKVSWGKGKWITFCPLDFDSLKIIVYWDGSLNGNEYGSSKVGYLIFVADKTTMQNRLTIQLSNHAE